MAFIVARRGLLTLLLLLAALSANTIVSSAPPPPRNDNNNDLAVGVGVGDDDTRPNFILIMTDDQDILLESMQAMPYTMKYLAQQGITFANAYISTPICCPSRTETISGRHFQNVRTQGSSRCMHASARYNVFNNSLSLFTKFQDAGYVTGAFGKLTNNQNTFWCPKAGNANQYLLTNGFNRITAPCDSGDFYANTYFDLYLNGTQSLHKLTQPVATHYLTSVIGNASLQFMDDVFSMTSVSAMHLNTDAKKTKTGGATALTATRHPLIAWIGPHAPHYPATPAEWYAWEFDDATAPRTPNFDAQNAMHHAFVSTNPSILEAQNMSDFNASVNPGPLDYINQLYKDRLRSLLSVDDIVLAIMDLLTNSYPSELENTIIVLTSDHGYDLGQLRLPCSKQEPYETAIKIPMFMRVPQKYLSPAYLNLQMGSTVDYLTGNIDILPTFLDFAQIEYDVSQDYDGMSWVYASKHMSSKNRDGLKDGVKDGLENGGGRNVGLSDGLSLDGIRREVWLTQYQSVGTYYFDHCSTWWPTADGNVMPGELSSPPKSNALNQTWILDDVDTNNWRALRILNASMDVMYAEFVNQSWTALDFESPVFYEYYEMSGDPWQRDNLYVGLNRNVQQALHAMLMTYGACKGSNCW